jgi:membrane associated rhomboid family serine protease
MPWATWSLVALNVLAFLAMLAATPTEIEHWFTTFGLVAADQHWYQFLTSSFVHAGWMHLIGNMLFLIVFGDNVEDVLGPAGLLLLYFVGGYAGDLMFVAANPTMTMPTVGASGCISALAGAYAVMFFNSIIGVRVLFFVFTMHTFHLRAFWVLLFWFGADVYNTAASHGVMAAEGGVNFVAHGAGFVVGFLVGIFATIYGATRRYETLAEGHAWFGYWPTSLENKPRARRVKRL